MAMNIKIVYYVLFVTSVVMSSAQKRPKRLNLHPRYSSGMKSPFQQPNEDGSHTVNLPPLRSPNYPPEPPKKSPFTPPSNKDDKIVVPTTSHPVPQAVPKVTTMQSIQGLGNVRNKANNFNSQKNSLQDRESPFKPPAPEHWRKDNSIQLRQETVRPFRPGKNHYEKKRTALKKTESTLERTFPSQRQNLQGIPPLATIDVQPRKSPTRRRPRPLATTYQDNPGHRDIHDVGPGATPWTRYTARPRPSNTGIRRTQSATARCGRQRYSPRKQMCCQGHLVRRQGVKPSCCGTKGYDMAFNNC